MELFQRIETLIGKKLPAFPTQEEEVMMLVERVSEAQRFARLVSVNEASNTVNVTELRKQTLRGFSSFCSAPQEMKEQGEKRKRSKRGDGDEDDTEQASGVRKKVKGGPGAGGKRGGAAWRGGR